MTDRVGRVDCKEDSCLARLELWSTPFLCLEDTVYVGYSVCSFLVILR